MSHSSDDLTGLEIAVIGMTCRFPGAQNIDEFWQNLRDGVESVTFFSDEELTQSGVSPATLQDNAYIKARPTLAHIDLFDAAFFGLNPQEVQMLDPQHRLFLECAWEVLEQAGYDPAQCDYPIGIYGGVGINTYGLFNLFANTELLQSVGTFQAMLTSDKDFLTTRVSYKLNLTGPSMDVQTACSTSLVAVHQASRSLLSGECDMALAGGVTVTVPQKSGYFYREGGIASPDGHCRAFDAQAQGTVFGSGVGIVVLKRLEDALADGDTIHAVIKGSALNNDGSLKVGYTAPSVEGQANVIRLAQAIAETNAETITYVEAHGTGTTLGDPIEIAALTQAFRVDTEKTNFCALGSVKTNIGHLDNAAGIAGFIKTVLALKHKQLPPSLHFERPNPKIDFATSPFYVNTALTEWPAPDGPRRAGVSSFGIGGTNAHLILEEAPSRPASSPSRSWQLLPLSAKTETALAAMTDQFNQHLAANPSLPLADVAYTLQVGRQAMLHRRFLVCQDMADALAVLQSGDPRRLLTQPSPDQALPIVFMFPGQGAQYVDMGRGLYEEEPLFRECVDHCAALLQPHLGLDLRHLLYPPSDQTETAAQQLKQTAVAQPALFTISYALAVLWRSWGIDPQAMIGHSIGEYVAACLAEVFSLEDALSLVATRGRLMQAMPTGAMLAVSLPPAEIEPLLADGLSLAVINGPADCVVSGNLSAIEQLAESLSTQEIRHRRLQTSHAFHSQMVQPAVAPFVDAVRRVQLHPPQLPYLSNVTGSWITAAQATDPVYWGQHLRQTVRFAEGVQTLLAESPGCILLEVGPGQTLSTLTRRQVDETTAVIASTRHVRETQPDMAHLLTALGRLWLHGVTIDWAAFYEQEQRHRLPLPTYPFERQRYWIDANTASVRARFLAPAQKKDDIADWFYVPQWHKSVTPAPTDTPATWLFFTGETPLTQRLIEQLRAAGHTVLVARPAPTFQITAAHTYAIDPHNLEDYSQLLTALEAQPDHIVCDAATAFDFDAVATLIQALSQENLVTIPFNLLTQAAQAVLPGDVVTPPQAALMGLMLVIAQEYPTLTCRSFDVPWPEIPWQQVQLCADLQAELTASGETAAATDPFIAYRGPQRWVHDVTAVTPSASHSRLRPGGVYLITGGLGRIGRTLVQYLARTWDATLILTSRSGLNSDEKVTFVQSLQDEGTEVLVLPADVVNEVQMQTAVDQIYHQFGTLHGVIHLANVSGEQMFAPITTLKPGASAAQFQPKVMGAQVLARVLQGRELDFCLLFSSLSATLGGLGFAGYAASNRAMDAIAHQQNQAQPVPWISVQWDGWQFGTGAMTNMGLADFLMSPEEGVQAFAQALGVGRMTPIIISTGDLAARLGQWVRQRPSANLSANGSQQNRPALQTAYAAPRNNLEEQVTAIWQQLLGIEQIGIYDNFLELGGNSLIAVQLISQVRTRFGVELPIRNFFETPTVIDLAQLIADQQLGDIIDEEATAALLAEIGDLSDEELARLLQEENLS